MASSSVGARRLRCHHNPREKGHFKVYEMRRGVSGVSKVEDMTVDVLYWFVFSVGAWRLEISTNVQMY